MLKVALKCPYCGNQIKIMSVPESYANNIRTYSGTCGSCRKRVKISYNGYGQC